MLRTTFIIYQCPSASANVAAGISTFAFSVVALFNESSTITFLQLAKKSICLCGDGI